MKTTLQVGFLTVAALCLMVPDVNAFQVTYEVNEVGGSGLFGGGAPIELNERRESQLGTYQFSGSVLPDRVGLIGVSTGFRAAVSRFIPGFSPEPEADSLGPDVGGEPSDSNTGVGDPPGLPPSTRWTSVTVNTSATGAFETVADINGLSATNDVGYVRFDWAVTGMSNIFFDGTGLGSVVVDAARSIASLRPVGDFTIPNSFFHDPSVVDGNSVNDLRAANLTLESFLVPFDFRQLDVGETPQIDISFELIVGTLLDVRNIDDLGNFETLFDADFSNTATLTNVTVLDANENEIIGASVVDSVTGGSLVASTVPEPSSLALLALIGCAGGIRRRR